MTGGLALQLGLATFTVAATVLFHIAGLSALLGLMRVHRRRLLTQRARLDQALLLVGAGFGLIVLHTAEVWGYAAVYRGIGAFRDFEEALYFSTVTYSTLGYGDVVLPTAWRIFGAIEAINGLILMGWSTAFFVSVVSRIRVLEHDWLADSAGGVQAPGLP